MSLRKLVLIALGVAGAVALLRRRRPTEVVEVAFDDGSDVRLERGTEARDLLDDVYAILEHAR